jgi:stage IV sporulation protein FB
MSPMNKPRSPWALEMGSINEIPIRVHITFLLLLVWLSFGSATEQPLREATYVVLVFVCVLLHELAHASVAKKFSIQTKDITLYPFGGVASILAQPTPKAELLIALVGPLTNVAIAAGLYHWTALEGITEQTIAKISLVDRLFITNIGLAVFNLLPALPMDGGRVLRATLNLVNINQPTKIAARVSQAMCVLMAIGGLYLEQPMLFIIAFIIFFGAIQEHVRAEARVVAVAFAVSDAMIPRGRLESFTHGTTVSKALRVALTSLQPLFPVLLGDKVVGIISREEILEHAATQPDEYLGSIMLDDLPTIEQDRPLSAAFSALEETGSSFLVVTHEDAFVGLLVHDRLSDFLLLQGLRNHKSNDDAEWIAPL